MARGKKKKVVRGKRVGRPKGSKNKSKMVTAISANTIVWTARQVTGQNEQQQERVIETTTFSGTPSVVEFGCGVTINTGNFQSVRVSAMVQVPAEPGREQEVLVGKCKQIATQVIADEVAKIGSEGIDVKKPEQVVTAQSSVQ